MDKIPDFKKTAKQVEAIDLLTSSAKHIMIYGGSRSGKTFIILYAIFVRASKVKSRHLIVRLRFNHVKTSVWLDSLPKVLLLCFPELIVIPNKQDYYIKFPNGSEVWVAGLDDKIRVEKVLGKEYSTIFFNECSQIGFSEVNVALTRLAEKNSLKNKAYYDENPPTRRHWSYPLFILSKNPEDWEDMDTSKYASMVINPRDNIENIDEEYIEDILDTLPEKQRMRFRDGLFSDEGEGSIYYAFDREKHVKHFEPQGYPIRVGVDFNVNPGTAVACEIVDDVIYFFDEIYMADSNTFDMAREIKRRYGTGIDIIPDSTGNSRRSSAKQTDHEILRDTGFKVVATKNPFREDRFNCANGLLEKQRIIVHPKCKYLIRDFEQLAHEKSDAMLGHISDAATYVAWKLYPLRKGSYNLTIDME